VTDFGTSALRLIGAIATGRVPTASELNDIGMIFNQMIDAGQTERLMVYSVPRVTVDQNNNTLPLVAGQQTYTLAINRPASRSTPVENLNN
jgi:hypothetical protein